MEDDVDRASGVPEGMRPTRRRFLQLVAGTLVGACAVPASGRIPVGGKVPPGPKPPPGTEKRLPSAWCGDPLPAMDKKSSGSAGPIVHGPLLTLASPPYGRPRLGPVRLLERWDQRATDWFGEGQVLALDPTYWQDDLTWLRATPVPPERCVVNTVWNKGRDASYSPMLRVLCVFFQYSNGWKETFRKEVGYAYLGALAPGDYVEVRYPFSTLRDGLCALDDYLVSADPQCTAYSEDDSEEEVFAALAFAFDPVADPLDLQEPLRLLEGDHRLGRYAAGRFWKVHQTPGQARVRLLP